VRFGLVNGSNNFCRSPIHRRVRESRLCPGQLQCRHRQYWLRRTSLFCRYHSDAVTLLSNAWNDNNSFQSPDSTNGRVRSETTQDGDSAGKRDQFTSRQLYGYGDLYRRRNTQLSEISGTGFRQHLYRGSIVSLYYYRQATVYKSAAQCMPRRTQYPSTWLPGAVEASTRNASVPRHQHLSSARPSARISDAG